MKKYKIFFHIFCHFFRKIFGNKNAIKCKFFGKNLGGQGIFFKLNLEVTEIYFSMYQKSEKFHFLLTFCFLWNKTNTLKQKILKLLLKSYKTPLFTMKMKQIFQIFFTYFDRNQIFWSIFWHFKSNIYWIFRLKKSNIFPTPTNEIYT